MTLDFRTPEDGSPTPFIAIAGANGAGKTTVLESVVQPICMLLTHRWLRPLSPPDSHFKLQFLDGDLELGSRVHLRITLDGSKLHNTLYIPSGYLPSMTSGQALEPSLQPRMPPVEALGRELEPRIHRVHQWWMHQHWEYPRTRNLDRLWSALRPFLGELAYADVSPKDHLPQFDARGVQVSFNELSSGERRIILLFMEIAMQCGEEGLALFDEPEAHVHPRWQRVLPAAMAELLPRGQVIVATHSPHMVEGLPTHQLFFLGELPW